MTVSMLRADDGDKQRAFLGLLANPVATPWTDPDLYALVHRHAHVLTLWCKRLGYQLAHLDQCYRLRRTPLPSSTAIGHRTPPERSELLLTLYAAACLEDHREDTIILQELSDMTRISAAGRTGWPYDPNLRRHRSIFLKALDTLLRQGVLERRTDSQLRDGWEQSGTGIGGGYLIHREALVLFIDTGDVALALDPPDAVEDQRGPGLLRRLLETQAVFTDELAEDERGYLAAGGQRTRLAGLAEEMTGGSVEHRADALVLSLPPDRSLPGTLVVDFPAATARDWAALGLLDRIAADTEGSFRTVSAAQVLAYAADLHTLAGPRLSAGLRESPQAVVDAAADRLSDLGLLRVDPVSGAWTLTPLAGRYRQAHLETGAEEADPSDTATTVQDSLGLI